MKIGRTIIRACVNALLVLLYAVAPVNANAATFSDVSPTMLDLTLSSGEMTTEQVSLTIHALLFRAINVDVVPSDQGALALNLSGIQINGGGGDTTIFEIKFTGDINPQSFDLNFVDSEFGGVLDSIPVSISSVPIPAAMPLLLSGLMLIGGCALRKRRR